MQSQCLAIAPVLSLRPGQVPEPGRWVDAGSGGEIAYDRKGYSNSDEVLPLPRRRWRSMPKRKRCGVADGTSPALCLPPLFCGTTSTVVDCTRARCP